jgi:hypothetical protein
MTSHFDTISLWIVSTSKSTLQGQIESEIQKRFFDFFQ